MAISGVRFGHVAFRVADVERAVCWYGDAFGARRVFHAPEDGGRQELMFLEFAKGQYIEIFTRGTDRVATPPAMIGYQHFCLVVDDERVAAAAGAPGSVALLDYVYCRSGRQCDRAHADHAAIGDLPRMIGV